MVPLHVTLIITDTDERFLTMFTLKFTRSERLGGRRVGDLRMTFYVSYEVIFLSKRFQANVTSEWFVPAMNSRVNLECTLGQERFPTNLTVETLAFVVDAHVYAHCVQAHEFLIACRADELLAPRLCDVRHLVLSRGKHHIAVPANSICVL